MKPRDNLPFKLSEKNLSLVSIILIFFIGFLVYSNIYSNGFHLDDYHTVVNNGQIHTLTGIPSFFISGNGFSGSPFVTGYRPVTVTVNALNYAFAQTDPRLYHFTNVMIHLAVSFLVSRIAFSLTGIPFISLLSGILFLVHPVNSEAVNYISARSTTLSALFILGAFLAFLEYRKMEKARWLSLSLLLMLLALLSKEVSVIFPLLVMAYDACFSSRLTFSKKLKTGLFYLLPVLFYLVVRHQLMTIHSAPLVDSASSWATGSSIVNQVKLIVSGSLYLATHTFFLYFYPYPLVFDRPFPEPRFDRNSILFLAFWTGILAWILVSRRKGLLPFLFAWFVVTLLPIFILPAISTIALFQENRGYLSGVGVSLLMAWGVFECRAILEKRFSGRIKLFSTFAIHGLLILLIVASAFAVYKRNQLWQSEVSLWSDTLKNNPDSFIGTFSLGYGYLSERAFDKAEFYFKHSLTLSPPKEYLYYIHNNLGTVYEYKDQEDLAISEYQVSERLAPRLSEAHLNLGRVYLRRGLYEKAGDELGTALEGDDRHFEQRVNAALTLERNGATKEAFELFVALSKAMPPSPEYNQLREIIHDKLKTHEY
jgi:tetratricopeptide (TPR) repeat protein